MFKIARRFLIYGGITALLTLPVTYKFGYNRGVLDATVQHSKISKLERIAEDQYQVRNPDDQKNYMVDFEKKTIEPYNGSKYEQKNLDEIFRK